MAALLVTRALLLALAIAAAPSPAHASGDAGLTLGYDIHVGGLKLGRMTLETRVEGDRYRVAVGARAADLLDRLVRWSYTAEAAGRFTPEGGVAPDRFSSDRTLRDRRWTARLDYDAAGRPTHTHVPPQSAEDEAAVPPEQRPGTVDLLSASAAIARAAEAKGGVCAARVPVYDGRRRYDVVASPAGERAIAAGRYGVFSGTAIGCRIEIHPVAGFRQARRNETDFWTVDPSGQPRGFDLWLGRPAPGDPLVPVRMEARELFYTRVIGHLAAIDRPEPRDRAADRRAERR